MLRFDDGSLNVTLLYFSHVYRPQESNGSYQKAATANVLLFKRCSSTAERLIAAVITDQVNSLAWPRQNDKEQTWNFGTEFSSRTIASYDLILSTNLFPIWLFGLKDLTSPRRRPEKGNIARPPSQAEIFYTSANCCSVKMMLRLLRLRGKLICQKRFPKKLWDKRLKYQCNILP